MLESVGVSRGISILLPMLTFCILVISREVAFVVAGTCISRLALLFSSAGSSVFRLVLFLFICICFLLLGFIAFVVAGCSYSLVLSLALLGVAVRSVRVVVVLASFSSIV